MLKFIIAFAISCTITLVVVPWMIPKLKGRGIVGKDLNKPNKPEVAEMGGIAVVIGFFVGVSLLLAADGAEKMDLLQASLSTVLSAAFVGMWDDLFNLRQRHKAVLPFLLALPLGVALDQTVFIPFIGEISFGPLMVLAGPLAITCAANVGNMLEGFNGLGPGLGIIMTMTLVILCVHHGRYDGMYLLIPLLGGLTAFLWFNKYPARIFPGDTLMLFTGATLAIAAMLSDLHVQTTFIFIPMIVEFFLKLKGKFKAENYCSQSANGYLEYHGRTESLTHIFMKHMKVTERSVVLYIWVLEVVMCSIVILFDLAV